jgi:hypothetical protein
VRHYVLGHLRHNAVEVRLGEVLLLFFKDTLIAAKESAGKKVYINEEKANDSTISRRSIHQWCSVVHYEHVHMTDEYFEQFVFDLISSHFNSRRTANV